MKYSVSISTSGQRQFKKLPGILKANAEEKILSLETQPRPFGSHKLQNTNFYRVRIGYHRIIYSIDDAKKLVVILDVAHRREVYR